MNKWSRHELVMAFVLYCQLPFSKINSKNQLIIKLAEKIKRTPSAVAWKLVNFASFDSALQSRGVKGATNASKLDKVIFEEFSNDWEKLTTQAAVYEELFNPDIAIKDSTEVAEERIGKEKLTVIKSRINQDFFRQSIMASYKTTCCITGINIPALLVASHIIPWSIDSQNRLNPTNGLCLNALHDKAFDRGLITIDENYKVVVSNLIKSMKHNKFSKNYLVEIEGARILLPDKFLPKIEFLKYHQENIFK